MNMHSFRDLMPTLTSISIIRNVREYLPEVADKYKLTVSSVFKRSCAKLGILSSQKTISHFWWLTKVGFIYALTFLKI